MGVRAATRRLLLEVLGWTLVLLGMAALVLPGPGLLLLFVGLLVLSEQYAWAERRMHPVRERALRAAREGVATWPRVLLSTAAALTLVGVGVLWGISPAAPDWWPVHERYWLIGGWGTGGTLIVSGALALGLLGWSWRATR
ncbi:PGPGW domain-containing protein [Nocardioides terrisoli]|uniref:PGPGW domain-containing protein n=1 Tax=Nocardioides terrisoli TaxID=3388267 RepID=UPI00287BAC4E|nr:PGPGW domain-containing protein [Nocardioides marmorisolisilvae]